MLTPEQKQAVIDGWQEVLPYGLSLVDYFRLCGNDGESVEDAKQRIITGALEMFGDPSTRSKNGVTAQQMIDALQAGELDHEIASFMGYC